MPHPNATEPPRHARMFEFIRQSQQATLTTERLAEPEHRPYDRQTLEDWCEKAVRSWGRAQTLSHP